MAAIKRLIEAGITGSEIVRSASDQKYDTWRLVQIERQAKVHLKGCSEFTAARLRLAKDTLDKSLVIFGIVITAPEMHFLVQTEGQESL